MTKIALCVRSNDELKQLIAGEIETIKTFMVPRVICEKQNEEAPLKQLIPDVTFTALYDEGVAMFLAYNRPTGGTEERLHGDCSVGFGGHADEIEDLVFAARGEEEAYPGHIYPTYTMTRKQLVETIYNVARREVREELVEDLFEKLGIKVENINMAIMEDPEPDDVGKVHTCISIMVDMPPEALIAAKSTLVEMQTEKSKREIMNLRVFGIMMDSLSKGDLEKSVEGMSETLTKDYQFERWSLRIVLTRALMIMNFVYANTTFSDFFQAAQNNVARAQKQLQDQQQAVAEANLGNSQVLTEAPAANDQGAAEAQSQG